jgi:hypothetical protein
VYFVIPTAIPIGPTAGSMTRGFPFELVPNAEPFFISLKYAALRKSRRGSVRSQSAVFPKSAHLPPVDKRTQSCIAV